MEPSVFSQKHCLLETSWVTGQLLTWIKEILVARGQHYIQNPLITSRQRSKSETKTTHKPQTENLPKENCSICLLQFEVDIKDMNGPVVV